ncbi:drug resistance transporter, EmrB/QacA subfamily [Jatrophihabitans endophyticus]|uniref:Drug resistance transporter, EmrB/QacA subfamily n=1 Tax=Jatrophihabitans endophyticus TaxID=1206085 RepID=A0A1M5DZ69_9ACTN|nr:MFS transporter [Jatrophihabitans endophyticus]SHF72328.1 drug resistance transporter, EmrB/QacA subfamily [Jatrophihabitans endophyticus]
MTALDSPAAITSATRNPLRWVVFAVVFAANIMDLLDATIVNIAGPAIHVDLGGGANTVQWLSAGYTLAFAVLLIAGARLGDILGRRPLFLVGSAGFTIFSAACALSPDIGVLIAFRALQGAFGALMIPQGFGLMREALDDKEFDKATAMFGPAMGLPMIAAPILAGALVDWDLWGTGWRLVFLINVPVGVVSFLLALRTLPRGASHSGMKLDVPGVWLIGLALVAIIYPLIEAQPEGWPFWTFALLAAGLVLLLVFLVWEKRRRSDALIEPSLLTNRNYLSGIAVALALFGAFGGLLLCVSLYGQLGEGWSPMHAGLTLMPMVIGMIAGMVGGTMAVARLGRHVLHIGLLVIAAGVATLALTVTGATSASSWDLLPGLFLVGAGAGASIGQLFQFILSSVSMREVGSASGVLEATQQLSTSLGVAILGTIFLSGFGEHLPTHALTVTAWACLAPIALAFALVFRLPMRARAESAAA